MDVADNLDHANALNTTCTNFIVIQCVYVCVSSHVYVSSHVCVWTYGTYIVCVCELDSYYTGHSVCHHDTCAWMCMYACEYARVCEWPTPWHSILTLPKTCFFKRSSISSFNFCLNTRAHIQGQWCAFLPRGSDSWISFCYNVDYKLKSIVFERYQHHTQMSPSQHRTQMPSRGLPTTFQFALHVNVMKKCGLPSCRTIAIASWNRCTLSRGLPRCVEGKIICRPVWPNLFSHPNGVCIVGGWCY